MAASVDGRIVVDGWPASVAAAVRREYDELHASFGADGWICGRITMQPFAKRVRTEDEVAREQHGNASRPDFRAEGEFEAFAFAIDPRGRLAWESNEIAGDHVVAILSERVSDEYLAFLREKGVSYLLAGVDDVDLGLALEKIGTMFTVRTLMLEGGGRINGGFLRAGLIDEISLVLAPVADGAIGTATLFDVEAAAPGTTNNPHQLALHSMERRSGNILWLRYSVGTAGRR